MELHGNKNAYMLKMNRIEHVNKVIYDIELIKKKTITTRNETHSAVQRKTDVILFILCTMFVCELYGAGYLHIYSLYEQVPLKHGRNQDKAKYIQLTRALDKRSLSHSLAK